VSSCSSPRWVIAIAIAVETYFQNERWPQIAALTVVAASLIGAYFAFTDPLTAVLPAQDAVPTGTALTGPVRIISLFLNVPGGIALILGALFSAYIFMPKKRVLDYSLDAGQPGDQFLFNIFIAIVAIPVNFVASLPGAIVALFSGPDSQPRADDPADRDRRHRREQCRRTFTAGLDELLLRCQARRAGSDLRGIPDVNGGVPRDPHPVHAASAARRAHGAGHGCERRDRLSALTSSPQRR